MPILFLFFHGSHQNKLQTIDFILKRKHFADLYIYAASHKMCFWETRKRTPYVYDFENDRIFTCCLSFLLGT